LPAGSGFTPRFAGANGIAVFEFDELPGTNARSFFRVVNPAYTP
jgi:hypothetical protein